MSAAMSSDIYLTSEGVTTLLEFCETCVILQVDAPLFNGLPDGAFTDQSLDLGFDGSMSLGLSIDVRGAVVVPHFPADGLPNGPSCLGARGDFSIGLMPWPSD